MAPAILEKEIVNELKAIRKDLDYLRDHMVDRDSILTEGDYEDLKEYRKGKSSLTSHENLKKELGI